MAIAYAAGSSGNSQGTGSNQTTQSVTVSTAVPAGAAVCIFVLWVGSDTTCTISDGVSGNTYTAVDDNTTGAYPIHTFYGLNIQNGPRTYTATIGAANTYLTILVDTFTGIATSGALDGHATNSQSPPGTGTDAITSGSFTTTTAGDLIWGVTMNSTGGNASTGTGFTTGQVFSGNENSEYKVAGAAGSYATTFTDATNGGTYNYQTSAMALKALPTGTTWSVASSLQVHGSGPPY
jgi:hypothetical protein